MKIDMDPTKKGKRDDEERLMKAEVRRLMCDMT